jgi:molecular chaperone GrpE
MMEDAMSSQEENKVENGMEDQPSTEDVVEAVDVAEVADAEVVDPLELEEESVVHAVPVEDEAEDESAAEHEIAALTGRIAQLEEELAAAQAEAANNLDQMKRVAAEFQNSKRRQEKQLADAIDRASEHVVRSLLPVLDGFDLAFQNTPDDLSAENTAWIEGFRQIQKTLLDLLVSQGVEAVPTEGEFDPSLHEAVSSEPSDEIESGHIIETLRVGYTHKEQTLRPALVRVAM